MPYAQTIRNENLLEIVFILMAFSVCLKFIFDEINCIIELSIKILNILSLRVFLT